MTRQEIDCGQKPVTISRAMRMESTALATRLTRMGVGSSGSDQYIALIGPR